MTAVEGRTGGASIPVCVWNVPRLRTQIHASNQQSDPSVKGNVADPEPTRNGVGRHAMEGDGTSSCRSVGQFLRSPPNGPVRASHLDRCELYA